MKIQNCATIKVVGVPPTTTAGDLLTFFSSAVGIQAIASDFPLLRRGWLPRTSQTQGAITARVQFSHPDGATKALHMFRNQNQNEKPPQLGRNPLEIAISDDDIIHRASSSCNRLEDAELLLGNRLQEQTMEVIQSWDRVRVEIMPERYRIDIFLQHDGHKYKLEVYFHDIISSSGCKLPTEDATNSSDAILLELMYAPRIYCAVDMPKKNRNYKTERYHTCIGGLQSQCIWIRQPDFTCNSSFGKSGCLCLKLQQGSSYIQPLKSFPQPVEMRDITLVHAESIPHTSDCVELHPLLEIPSEMPVPYEILFQLNSLVHTHKLPPNVVDLDLLKTLSKLSLELCTKILQRMHRLKSTCYNPVQFVEKHSYEIARGRDLNAGGSKQRLMRCFRVLITPTKVYLQGPEAEKSNYIVQHFSKFSTDFARVSFVDEDWSKLSFSSLSTQIEHGFLSRPLKTGIHSRILSILKNGFRIGEKKFEFLAFSASQLRGNSVWMFASNSEVTAATIREFMGQFTPIRSISKCAARMGQLFSSSTQTINVSECHIQMLPDIEVSTDTGTKYCFSDGIGQISRSFARQVAEKCGLPHTHTPSAYQIRYGGFKGVVAVNRNSFSKLSLRGSMKKFESQNTMLNITKWSDYQPAFLNREIITLLSTLGVPDDVFDEMQNEHLMLLDKILTSCDDALKSVQRMYGKDLKIAERMLKEEYEPTLEPYLFMVLKAQRDYQLVDIRTKCRIFVPRARVSIGCLDEIGRLDYGQVYIRVTLKNEEQMEATSEEGCLCKFDGMTAVVVGKVVVTKNPCLHPGDVRVLDAIYDAELDEMGMIDCLVFPQKGKRPHPNECSGGDLDGDLYFVSWDEQLIPHEIDPPMDYSGPRQRTMDHDVSLEEIQNFFVDYMENDTLGTISNAHLVYSDQEPLKARSENCLELAKLHSMSVDFAKTGAPAEMPKHLIPKKYPDFMERHDKPMYVSTGVLGKLYHSFMSYTRNGDAVHEIACRSSYDYDLEVEGFVNYLDEAQEYYEMYHERFSNLMCYYKAEDEEEIVTGNLSNKSLYLKKDNKQYGELKDRILVAFKDLQKEAVGWFKNSCAESEYSKMASAWYHVVYHPKFSGTEERRFLSFPWVNFDVLLDIKASKRHMRKLEELREEGMRDLCDDVDS
ncbi:RNA-dependent RNA polymerase [Rhynchospora pubera]|uniref:RNA-dependent RNA polymerase n=1 Tax=Rhynchospora pubera TaxID=906938 RepID=A0AAV8GHC6_9POAL|nr:RNA-dependent RNA polymerase [Rhynchospora pubera]